MTGTGWASVIAALVLIAVLAIVLIDSRSIRQRLRNDEGRIAGLELDLDAARARISELQTYLSDYDSWAADPAQPVPARLADRAIPDRWSSSAGAADGSSPQSKPAGKN